MPSDLSNHHNYDMVLSDVISLNPTGTLDFNGTFSLNGNNSIVQNPESASKENLDKSMNNEVICGSLEHFENQETKEKIFYIKNYKENKKIYFILIFVFIFLLLILYLI